MSVVKSKRTESKLEIVTKSIELSSYTIHICSNEKRKLKKMKKLVNDGVMTRKNVDECYMSWKAHAKQGNTHNLILSMDKFYKNLWKEGNINV